MFEINIVRFAVIVYIGLGGFMAFLLWRNPAASNALPNAGIVLAGLLPAFIAILPYWKKIEITNNYNLVLFFDEESRQVINTGLFSPYLRAYHNLYVVDNPSDLKSREISDDEVPEDSAKQYWPVFHHEKGLDLIERLVLNSFANEFHVRWNIEYQSKQTPTGKTRTGSFVGNTQSKTIQTSSLNKMLEHNQLFKGRLVNFDWPSFELPPNSKFLIQEKEGSRVITIEIPSVSGLITMSISPSHSGIAPGGVWGVFKPNDSLSVLEYRTEIKLTYRSNAIDSKAIKRWFDNISRNISKFDWETIDSEVERSLMRQLLVNPAQSNN